MKIPSKKKKRTNKPPKGYDSWFEFDLHKKFKRCEYHVDKITYTQVRTYEPDFIYRDGEYTIYIEAKGRFRDRAEAKKYVDISQCLGEQETLVFVFQNPRTAMPGARRRRDGTRYTMQEWADKQGFTWYTPETCPAGWSKK